MRLSNLVRQRLVRLTTGSGVLPTWRIALLLTFGFILVSCSSSPKRPCSEGGQAAHDPGTGPIPFQGTKKCFQKPDESGVWVNDGKYFEWYPSEKIAVTGEYKMGKKTGRWAEYDENGKKVSDRYFENGKEVPAP